MEKISAVIAAAGLGTRLKNYKGNTSTKVLIEINNQSMISLQIQQLSNWGIKKFVVITNPAFDELIRNDLKNSHPNKDIKYTIQDKPLGIAHALKQAKNCVPINSKILFILGDNFFGENPILNINLYGNFDTVLFLKSVSNPSEFGVANIVNEEIKIIEEKPEKPKSNLAVLGLYLYSYNCFELIEKLEFSARGELEITDLNNLYIKSKNVSFKTLNDWWIDAGTEDRIEELKKLI